MIFLMISLGINAQVTLGKNDQGKVIYIYAHDDQVKIEKALIELKEYRVSFPLLKEDRDGLFDSRLLWMERYDLKVNDLKIRTIQRDVMIGSTVVATLVALILAVFK